ncbi:hypothetical protein GUJ93_ZPchr0458g22485 [Zizania palustris]|uniref:Uncharacterized protein n=1 Tax=Zizania palustris TaxID=103762 RepID=A0A8J5VE68_ZIZPA|nr:hypothetical protein GUJ93_ZPchr0458g22485 [Zizania palustris]
MASSSVGSSVPNNNDHHDLLMLDRFHRWMAFHDRSYPNDDEKLHRFEVYRHNIEYIERTNRDGGLGYQLGENDFTDLTSEEFAARYIGGLTADDSKVITSLAGDVSEGYVADGGEDDIDPAKLQIAPPSSVNWLLAGAVTPAKSQGRCGSCWIFAAVATVESMHQIATGELVDLSEQQVLDCDDDLDQYGCKGGQEKDALLWIKKKFGIVTEVTYPYKARSLHIIPECRYNFAKNARRVGRMSTVMEVYPAGSEAALTTAVARQPVAVGIEANANMQFYNNTSGIYTGPCGTKLNHAVVVVGYGRDNVNGVDYWIVKNSWGSDWGQDGFFLMRKGADGPNGLCGIVRESGVYPIAWKTS